MVTVVHIIILLIVISVMIFLLLSINFLEHYNFRDNERVDIETLMKDVEERSNVITHESIFNELVHIKEKSQG